MHSHPSKQELLARFVDEYGMPKFYIGNGDKDIQSCKDLNIPTISVNLVSIGEFKGDHDISEVKELDAILKN